MHDSRAWSSLTGLMLTAKQAADGLYTGNHQAKRFGGSAEFHDYRPYTSGEDTAAIDWKLFGRTDRYYLKQHQRPTDLHVYLLVDCSASMYYPHDNTKLHYAKTLAAALAFVTLRQHDRVGLGLFSDKILNHQPVAGTWAHLQRLTATLETAKAQGRADLASAITQAHALLKRRSLVVIISDFLDEPAGLWDGLNRLRHARHDVALLQVLSAAERDLSKLGDNPLQLVDLETRQRQTTDTRKVRDRYTQLFQEHQQTLQRGCAARHTDYALFPTDEPMTLALRRYLTLRANK